jgi:hypothetical protein
VENFYYDAIYTLLDADKDSRDKMLQMKYLKAKILRLKSAHYKSMQLDVRANNDYRDEQPSLYQLLKTRKRQRQRTITSLLNTNGSMGRTTKELMGACYDYYSHKFAAIPVNVCCHRSTKKTTRGRMRCQGITGDTGGSVYGDSSRGQEKSAWS